MYLEPLFQNPLIKLNDLSLRMGVGLPLGLAKVF